MLIALCLASAGAAPSDVSSEPLGTAFGVLGAPMELPGHVFVVDREQIARAGYRSVADALAQVPGLSVSYDEVDHNVAVRGLLGTPMGSHAVAVRLDGVVVDFPWSDTTWLGPELLPITAVERIEVLRGPATALVGMNGFAAVVDVITRRAPSSAEGLVTAGELRGAWAPLGVEGFGGDGTVELVSDRTTLLLSASASTEDRQGIAYPSPEEFSDDDVRSWLELRRSQLGLGRDARTGLDRATPMAVLGRLTQVVAGGRLSVSGLGRLSVRDDAWSSTAVLSDEPRRALGSWTLGAAYERAVAPGLELTIRAGGSGATTLPGDRTYEEGEAFVWRRELSTLTESGAVQLRYLHRERGSAMIGADVAFDQIQLPTWVLVDPIAGSPVDTRPGGSADQRDVGLWARAGYELLAPLSISAAGRLDGWWAAERGGDEVAEAWLPSGRVALNLHHHDRVALVVVGGTGAQAPSPEQLFADSPIASDPLGSVDLAPSRMDSAETTLEVHPVDGLTIALNGFLNRYHDLVGHLPSAGVWEPFARDADGRGGELEGRLRRALGSFGAVDAQLGVGVQHTRMVPSGDATLFGTEPAYPDDEGVPRVSTYARLGGELTPAHLSLVVEHRYVGERTPSASNLASCTVVNPADPCYRLPDYPIVDAAVSSLPVWTRGPRPAGLRALVRVENLLDARHLQVGTGGIDVPGPPRTLWVRADVLH